MQASMSNFRILFPAEVDAQLIATDGNLVLPRHSFKPWIAVGQRLDFIITTTTHKVQNFFFGFNISSLMLNFFGILLINTLLVALLLLKTRHFRDN